MSGYAQMGRLLTEASTMDDMVQRGIAFSSGRGGRIDYVEAHKCFNLAAARGSQVAIRHREEIASEMSREQIAEALRSAREWLARQ